MPTFRNDASTQSYWVRHTSGEKRQVLPGQSIETYEDLSGISDCWLQALAMKKEMRQWQA